MSSAAFPAELTEARYVRLTTFRRNGTPMHTPVWFGRTGDQLVVWSNADAGKMKRARHTPGVAVARCDRFGKQLEGPEHLGDAVEAPVSRHAELGAVLDAKYGWQKRIMKVGETARRLLRRPDRAEGFLIITLH